MPSRLPLRLRVALAFALTTAVALVGLGAFVYYQVRDTLEEQLNETVDGHLESVLARPVDERQAAVRRIGGDSFGQVLTSTGGLVATSGQVVGDLVPAAVLPDEEGEDVVLNRDVSLLDEDEQEEEPAILLLRREGDLVFVVGTSREDADDALGEVGTQLLVGGPVALLLASLLGYLVAGTALGPIERMRARAASISSESHGERLPLPEADDEVRRLGVTLNAMLDRLDEGMQRERRFVAEASHELRTPLALLRVELDLALSRARTNEELVAAIGSASEEVDRLTRLARDLLLLAASDEDRLALEPTRFDLALLLATVAERFAPVAQSRTVRVTGDRPLPVVADRDRLDQVVANLLDNALRHGGEEVVLAARQVDGQVVIEVTDGGAGLPTEFHERAFDRFTRGEGTRADGRGLGLAIVRAIVRAHGGEVTIGNRSTESGTVVTVRIPADPGEEA
jgi:heavy metal sensor kinase